MRAVRGAGPAPAAARRADEQPRPAEHGPAGERAELLPGCLRRGQPRRPLPAGDRGEPLAAAVRRRVAGDRRPRGMRTRGGGKRTACPTPYGPCARSRTSHGPGPVGSGDSCRAIGHLPDW
ncbi:hypothetical protein SBRY_40934 [Actinacidiphila bryophytorum]|uniref:Uncharacterized protein n=1 Tax=Actinacidiphila bryophytorum TaxID=1436133 RepID=A0A9W4H3U9_9ACTN|nr:hypothetical protein SBRY_40934 [Actinacidiphila bryophytorum]